MASRYARLPLRGMTVFEAAARHGRFTAAADELLMTQARVSQHIAELEGELGTALFRRRHRGVELTATGAALLATVQQGLRTLSDGVDRLRRQTSPKPIQILTDYGFAAWWLMPRLPDLHRLLPGSEIRLATTQADLDITGADFDLAIMFGQGDWAGFSATPLFAEQVYPVCARSYLKDRPMPFDPAELAQHRLLHLRGNARDRWFTWSDWFEAHGASLAPDHEGLAFDNFQLVLQAALLGQGICIGWAPLIDDLVAGGALVRLADRPLGSSRGYHIVEHAGRSESAGVAALKAWLLAARSSSATVPAGPAQPVNSALPRSQGDRHDAARQLAQYA